MFRSTTLRTSLPIRCALASLLAIACSGAPNGHDGTATASLTSNPGTAPRTGTECWIKGGAGNCDPECLGLGGGQACCTADPEWAWAPGVACGAQCVNTDYDPQNCGGCGVVCSGTCSNGSCVATECGKPPTPPVTTACTTLCDRIGRSAGGPNSGAVCGGYTLAWPGQLAAERPFTTVDACVQTCVPVAWNKCSGEMAKYLTCLSDSVACEAGKAATFGDCSAESTAVTTCMTACSSPYQPGVTN